MGNSTREVHQTFDDWQPHGPCVNCGQREATVWWVDDGGTLALVHGFGRAWCRPCCLQKNIEHAEEQAAKLPQYRLDAERMKLLEMLGRRIIARHG